MPTLKNWACPIHLTCPYSLYPTITKWHWGACNLPKTGVLSFTLGSPGPRILPNISQVLEKYCWMNEWLYSLIGEGNITSSQRSRVLLLSESQTHFQCGSLDYHLQLYRFVSVTYCCITKLSLKPKAVSVDQEFEWISWTVLAPGQDVAIKMSQIGAVVICMCLADPFSRWPLTWMVSWCCLLEKDSVPLHMGPSTGY